MIVVYAIEFLLFVTLVAVVATQVIAPLWRGTPVFPMFQKGRRRLEEELSQARETSEEAHLEQEVKEEKERTRRIRRGQRFF